MRSNTFPLMLALTKELLHVYVALLPLSLVAPQPVPVSVNERGINPWLKAKAKVPVPTAFNVQVEACPEKAIKNSILSQSKRGILKQSLKTMDLRPSTKAMTMATEGFGVMMVGYGSRVCPLNARWRAESTFASI